MDDAKVYRKIEGVGTGFFVPDDHDPIHIWGRYFAKRKDALAYSQGREGGRGRAIKLLHSKFQEQYEYVQLGGSDWMHSFHSSTAVGGPAAISAATLQGIGNAPMFNPLNASATVPGNSTGIVPSGLYLASQTGGSGQPVWSQLSTEELRTKCNENGLSCRGQNGGFLHRNTLIKQLGGGGRFQSLYSMNNPNQPTLH